MPEPLTAAWPGPLAWLGVENLALIAPAVSGSTPRMASLTGEIQIVEAAVLGFSGAADLGWRVGDPTRTSPRV